MSRTLRLVVASVALTLTACGSTDAPTADSGTDSTLGGIGVVPPSTGADAPLTLPVTAGTFPGGEDVPVPDLQVGQRVLGNKVLLIGDSLFAGLASRYGGEACEHLVPLGWQVAVEAESGRFIDLADRVLDARLTEGWDAVVIMLGTNYGGDEVGYEAALSDVLDRLAPRPVIVLTTTVFREMQNEVNAAIARQVLARDNVDALDWSTISEGAGVLSGDGIHATDGGRSLMAEAIALLMGQAPVTPGDCLSSQFTDDSAVNGAPGGPGGLTTVPNTTATTSSGSTSPTPTTSPVVTTPTTVPVVTTGPTTTAAPVTTVPVTTPTTPAPTTAPPTTAAPTTAPPTTAAPTTAPPATSGG